MQGAPQDRMPDGRVTTSSSPAGGWALGLSISWLVFVTLGCISNAGLIFTPEVAVNVAIFTVPLFVSAWAMVGVAARVRRDHAPKVFLAPLIGGGVGLLVGIVGLTVVYFALWPAF